MDEEEQIRPGDEFSRVPYEPRTPIEYPRGARSNSDWNYVHKHYNQMGAKFESVTNLLHYHSEKPAESFKEGDLVVEKEEYKDIGIEDAKVWAVVGKYTRSYVYIIRIPRNRRTGKPLTLEEHMKRQAMRHHSRAHNEGRGGGRKSMKNRRGLRKNRLTRRR